METLLEELKRYVGFAAADEAALCAFAPHCCDYFPAIAEDFYERIRAHEDARNVFRGLEQVERLKRTLCEWLEQLVRGPWDEAYCERRLRIGHVHVKFGLPQRYMFGAVNVVRSQLLTLSAAHAVNTSLQLALHKILDIELAILLESYSEANLARMQRSQEVVRDGLERKLAQSEARYDEIVEKAEALITTTDAQGRILLFNAKCEAITGLARASMRGADWLEVFVSEADRSAVAGMRREALAGSVCRAYEGSVRTPHGEHRVRWQFTPLPGGETLCAIGIDVSHEYALAVRTRRSERLASLGIMAAGLAHEIRNPLNSANLQLSVAQRRLAREGPLSREPTKRALELAETEMQRLAALVEDFLTFARPHPLRLTLANPSAIVADVMSSLTSEAASAGVSLELAPALVVASPPATELDVEKLTQVLLHLLRNAIEASEQGGRVSASVESSAGTVRVSVADQGSGIPADAPIFEPFFTTKPHGTGLGLAIVHRIVTDHGGNIEVQSKPGRTVFSLALPVTQATCVPSDSNPNSTASS